jgi:hypothetical protein
MRQLPKIVVTLVFSLTMIATVVRSTAQAEAMLLASFFTNLDGSACKQPCLLGVQPETRFRAASEQVQRHPLVQRLTNDQLTANHGDAKLRGQGITITIRRSEDGMIASPLATSVSFALPDASAVTQPGSSVVPTIRLGDLILVLGIPETVYIGQDHLWLLYFRGQLMFGVQLKSKTIRTIEPVDWVSTLALSGGASRFQPSGHGERWLGFGSVDRYAQGATQLSLTRARVAMEVRGRCDQISCSVLLQPNISIRLAILSNGGSITLLSYP